MNKTQTTPIPAIEDQIENIIQEVIMNHLAIPEGTGKILKLFEASRKEVLEEVKRQILNMVTSGEQEGWTTKEVISFNAALGNVLGIVDLLQALGTDHIPDVKKKVEKCWCVCHRQGWTLNHNSICCQPVEEPEK